MLPIDFGIIFLSLIDILEEADRLSMPCASPDVGFFDVLYSQMLRRSSATTRRCGERTKEPHARYVKEK